MIRNILSAITCLLLSFPLSAQVKNSCTAADIRRDEIARLVLAHGTEPHNKTTAFDGCRLKAFMLENTDSMRLYYSDNGRSHFDFNNMKYDNIFYPSFDRIYGYGAYAFNSYDYVMPVIYNANYMPQTRPDSVLHYFEEGSLYTYSVTNASFIQFTYDNEGRVLTALDTFRHGLYVIFPNVYTVNEYNYLGNISRSITYTSPAMTDTTDIRYFRYDGVGRLLCDSVMHMDAGAWWYRTKYIYSYDTNNYISAISYYTAFFYNWVPTTNYSFTYYPFGRLKVMRTEHITDSLNNLVTDSFGWVPDHSFTNYKISSGIHPYKEPSILIKNISPVNHLPDSIFYCHINSFGDTARGAVDVYDYNSSGLPVHRQYYHFPGFFPDWYNNYYYEMYDNTAVNIPLSNKLNIYPNPATDMIYLQTDGSIIYADIVIYNVLGCQVLSSPIQLTNGKGQLPVQDLPPGTYTIALRNNTGQQLSATLVKH